MKRSIFFSFLAMFSMFFVEKIQTKVIEKKDIETKIVEEDAVNVNIKVENVETATGSRAGAAVIGAAVGIGTTVGIWYFLDNRYSSGIGCYTIRKGFMREIQYFFSDAETRKEIKREQRAQKFFASIWEALSCLD